MAQPSVSSSAYADPIVLTGDWLLSISPLTQSVERSGQAGQIRVENISLEMVDRVVGGAFLLRDTIFGNVTGFSPNKAIISLVLNIGGTNFGWWGYVDYDTLEYPDYFDDQAGANSHSVKFNILNPFSMLDGSAGIPVVYISDVSKLRDIYLDGIFTHPDTQETPVTCVPVGCIYEAIATAFILDLRAVAIPCTTTNHSFSYSVADTYQLNTDTPQTFNLLWLTFQIGGAASTGWVDAGLNNYSLCNLSSWKELWTTIAAQLSLYPFFVWNPTNDGGNTDSLVVRIKQRLAGTLHEESEFGILLSSTKYNFVGYNAVRVSNVGLPAQETILPSGFTDYQFGNLGRTLTEQSWVTMAGEGPDSGTALRVFDADSNFQPITQIIHPDSGGFTAVFNFMASDAYGKWIRSGLQMYERTYQGIGVGGETPFEILDEMVIDGVTYSCIEIQRDFVKNTMTLKFVNYT
jgi:hypothetical protein